MQPNFLLLTVDDMNYNSCDFLKPGAEPLLPHLTQLRKEGVWFENSHVTIAVCQPSRSVLMTGRYPHRNGARGFECIDESVTTLTQVLHGAGYYNGIIGKEDHLAPKEKFFWDHYQRTLDDAHDYGRSPSCYYDCVNAFLDEAEQSGKPFFLMANSHDPHRPFAGSADEEKAFGRHIAASYTYSPEDVRVPSFLPDLPDIRLEISQYLTSTHRADEIVGQVLRALREHGHEEDTVVLFLSDNGMAFPFCKANCYLNSTKSPYIVRWPGMAAPGSEAGALVSGIDYMPTVLEIAGLEPPTGMDGTSLVPLLRGRQKEQYGDIYTSFFKTARNQVTKKELHFPMRCVQDKKYAYLFNSWSDGECRYTSETMAGLTFKAMEAEPSAAERVKLYRLRVPEELYDYESDPNALHNLIDAPEHRERVQAFRLRMLEYMRSTQDELLDAFEQVILKEESRL